MATVTASGLTKRFEATCALDRVDLVVGEGEVRGLLGPNGAGKTTLLRLLLGLLRADSGTIALFGERLDAPDRLALGGVAGFVEEPSFYPYLSARANLELLAELDRGAAHARIDDVLAQVELSERAGDRVGGYSSGMRQRLGIAAALMRSPRLLLLDEPTSGLDPAGVRFVARLIESLSAGGVAVLLSSHQIGEVEGICDAFSVLSRGRLVWSGTATEMRAQAPASSYLMSTSDDERAVTLAAQERDVDVERTSSDALAITADEPTLDGFVLALAGAGVAVRRLELAVSPLESMFFALTDQAAGEPAPPLELERQGQRQTLGRGQAPGGRWPRR